MAEIMYAIYQGLSKRQLCKEYVRRKANNPLMFDLHQHVATSVFGPCL